MIMYHILGIINQGKSQFLLLILRIFIEHSEPLLLGEALYFIFSSNFAHAALSSPARKTTRPMPFASGCCCFTLSPLPGAPPSHLGVCGEREGAGPAQPGAADSSLAPINRRAAPPEGAAAAASALPAPSSSRRGPRRLRGWAALPWAPSGGSRSPAWKHRLRWGRPAEGAFCSAPKELKLPMYKAHSPQIGMRRYLIDLLTVLSNRFNLCPTARHLAIYLLDLFMDRYDTTVKQLHVTSFACLLLASKFEEKEDKVPKLEHLNNVAYMCNVNVVLNKKDLLRMEMLLLENFNWNLCLPTAAHYIDYYLHASVGENDLHDGWPVTSLTKTKAFLEKYAYYFLDFSVQDHAFLHFRPSLIAAACVCASRICMQISPAWTTQLELLTCYSWEHLVQCIEMMLICYENDIKEASNIKKHVTIQHQEREAVENLSHQATTQVLFQQSSYHPLALHPTPLSQFQSPVQDLCSAYRDSLEARRASSLLVGCADSSFRSCAALQAGLGPPAQPLPLQMPIAVQVALGTEPRHCVSMAYSSTYLSDLHPCAARCFDG
ncbi:cyclin-J-like protein isoform X2 [Columba livia]|uniref:cyclin-J-like protein isoform X2 n=1 Tax=Columba livia TaxID=8932 RepID=UPI0031BB95DC